MFTARFNKISKNDINISGGKGASLGEMTKAKMPIPKGFIVLVSAFDIFFKETGLEVRISTILKKIKADDINLVELGSKKIRKIIGDVVFPKNLSEEILKEFDSLSLRYVAVRSSATAEDSLVASWAGELDSYLNVTRNNLLDSVKKCWASLFTPRAIFYRFEKKLHDKKISVAVVIQEMIQSEVSGICFTVHPVTKDYNQVVIEAGYGLGEAVVGGMITPDAYVLNKKDKTILDININRQKMMIVKKRNFNIKKKVPDSKQGKQKLTDMQILELLEISNKIEQHYNLPQDIEWAFAKNKFFIVQSRPITTL
jgi:pyruvate, water dikinase